MFIFIFIGNLTTNLICKASHPPSSAPSTSKGNLPVWASWRWGWKYLPAEIHAKKEEFSAALSALRRHTFTDRNKGTAVVLGLGLLLRECWRVVEVEADDSNIPGFLRGSVLSVKMAEEVVATMKGVSGCLVVMVAQRDSLDIVEGPGGKESRQSGQEEREGKGEVSTGAKEASDIVEGVGGEKLRKSEQEEEREGEGEVRISTDGAGNKEEQEVRGAEKVRVSESEKNEKEGREEEKMKACVRGKGKGKGKRHRSPSPGPSRQASARTRKPSKKSRGSDYA